MFTNIMVLITALYLLFMGLTLGTKNFVSSILFKYIPTVLGIFLLLHALQLFGYIPIGI